MKWPALEETAPAQTEPLEQDPLGELAEPDGQVEPDGRAEPEAHAEPDAEAEPEAQAAPPTTPAALATPAPPEAAEAAAPGELSGDGDSHAPLTPTPRSETPTPPSGQHSEPVWPQKASAPAPRSEPEPRVEVVTTAPDPVADFVRSARPRGGLPDDPVAAFDELYLWQARALTRQAFLLCGHRRIAERSVRWAFHQAWQHWPKVLAAGEPTRTVRAAAYDYALSPWHQFHPGRRTPRAYPGRPTDRAVLEAFLGLPRSYRAALLLHYGLGLTLPETAAEVECSTEAAAGRVTHGRAALEECWPPLARTPRWQRGSVLARTLRELAAAQPVHPVPPRLVRRGSLRTTRLWTRASIGLTAAVTAATAFTLLTTETGGGPPPEKPVVRTPPPRTFAPVTLPGGLALPGRPGPSTAADMGTGTTRTSDAKGAGRAHRGPAGGPGQAYLPQLRSTNERVHPHDFHRQDADRAGRSDRAGSAGRSGRAAAPVPES
ncbi:hypothetical protein ITI46_24460 [Streptomyces oryzae]|uniref:RNA polymerase sigma factor 70 region 4 type 2 domain-containing protein n=1 Tax=Streptomyces oryzae TaxID=1434886 RepID=A0ABS3XHL4_9ACTN|nr:sigma-70 family RNA polymerase sigma factor [Streptomyces oryzae]MBO8194784.1 hypothetical protein [Streptomyces oryzae]